MIDEGMEGGIGSVEEESPNDPDEHHEMAVDGEKGS